MGFWNGLLATLYGNEASGAMTKEKMEKIARKSSRAAANTKALQSAITKWRWDRHVVIAHTKSEARALLKRKLKLARLPVGANVVKA